VGSSNKVTNLNADLLDGLYSTNFLLKSERCLPSIAELRARAAGFVPCVTVLGYYVPADGGGGDFCWDPTANVDLAQFPTGEDGGTVIKPNALPPSVAGRWRRVQGPPLNVRWFGARGNGIDDDSATIQNAINVALPGGTVYFPTGAYHVAFELVLNNATNLSLAGDGPPSCLDFDVPDAGLLGVHAAFLHRPSLRFAAFWVQLLARVHTATATNLLLLLYGKAGTNYVLEGATNLGKSPVWVPATNFLLTNSFQLLNEAVTNRAGFFRAKRL
jgi:hypothetical protein